MAGPCYRFVTGFVVSGTVKGEGVTAMIVTLSLNPEVEGVLEARARARGVSLDDYLQELVAREAGVVASTGTSGEEKARAFVQWASGHRHRSEERRAGK